MLWTFGDPNPRQYGPNGYHIPWGIIGVGAAKGLILFMVKKTP